MKPRSHRPLAIRLAFAATLLSLALPSLAAPTGAKAPSKASPTATNAMPVQAEIPKSVFVLPASPQKGKDPFFPRSMRPYPSPSVGAPTTNSQPIAVAVKLRFHGISGAVGHRLAIINNRTFETNEEGVVPTSSGPAHIRCLEIKADSVVVQVGAERQVLRLRPGL